MLRHKIVHEIAGNPRFWGIPIVMTSHSRKYIIILPNNNFTLNSGVGDPHLGNPGSATVSAEILADLDWHPRLATATDQKNISQTLCNRVYKKANIFRVSHNHVLAGYLMTASCSGGSAALNHGSCPSRSWLPDQSNGKRSAGVAKQLK